MNGDTLPKRQRVLVTGGEGFVGRHVVAAGRLRGAEVFALSRIPGESEGVTAVRCDMADVGNVREIVRRIRPQGIIHLAAGGVGYATGSVSELLAINTLGLAGLLEAAAALKPPPAVVIAGSGFEYAQADRPIREGDRLGPTSAYGVSKASATLVAGFFREKLPVTVLRLFSLYGPGEREPRLVPYVIACSQRNVPIELTSGEQVRDYTFVEDAAEAFWRTLDRSREAVCPPVLNVASGRPITLRKFVELVGSEMAQRGFAPDLRFGARPYRTDEMMTYTADIGALTECLTWSPETTLEKGIGLTVDAMLAADPS